MTMKKKLMSGIAVAVLLSTSAHAQVQIITLPNGLLSCQPLIPHCMSTPEMTAAIQQRLDHMLEAEKKQRQEQAAKEREAELRKGPQHYDVDPVHLSCQGVRDSSKLLQLDIIPREGKALVTKGDKTQDLPLYGLWVAGRNTINQFGNRSMERIIKAARIDTNSYMDDGWPNIRYYENNGNDITGAYSCIYN